MFEPRLLQIHFHVFRRSDQSEYHSARDFTPDLDKKIVTWDEENFEQVP